MTGSITGRLTVIGTQGHVAYPHRANNPSNVMVKILKRIKETTLDNGTKNFQPSNLEITKINIDKHADNVIPGSANAVFNIRFNDKHSSSLLNKKLNKINLVDFIEDIEGPIGIVQCSTSDECNLLNYCNIKTPINKINNNLACFINKNFKFKGKFIKYNNNIVFVGKRSIDVKKLISLAHLNRISVCSSGLYKTPKVFRNTETLKVRPFLYLFYGAAVSEVIIDTLTGENKLLQVDILHDVGKSINPSIDLGQIEGGFVQGQGWLTMEEVNWNSNGQITTFSPSTYKIPAVSDVPRKFNIEIFKQGKNKEIVVNKAKTTGEPPLMLAMSVFYAIKDAIASVGKYKITPILDAPATPEKILMSLKELKNRNNHNKN